VTGFALAFVVFIVAHTLPTRPPIRTRLVARLGERGFQLAYSTVSIALLTWLILAAIEAPYIELWPPAAWHMHLAIALMPVAFALAAIGVGVPNPLSISLYPEPEGWCRSGVLRWVRHPLLVGLTFWGATHALANGALVSLVMFGGLALFAVLGVRLVERRRCREIGTAAYAAAVRRRTTYSDTRRQALAALIGLVAMGALLVLHPQLFGADPLAWIAL
jgi:uncharacterized membrane protein